MVAWSVLGVVSAKLALFLPLFRLTWAQFVVSCGVLPVRWFCGVTFLFEGGWLSVSLFVASSNSLFLGLLEFVNVHKL